MPNKRSKQSKEPVHEPVNPTDIILESISDGVFTVDHDWRITSFNRAAEDITGVPREEAIGRRCCEVFRASMCESECALRYTLDHGKPIVNKSAFIIDAEGQRIPISVSTAILRDTDGRIVGGVETFRDLTLVEELRKEIQQRYEAGDMASRSPLMRKLFELLPQVAASPATVVIQGETGAGKEVLARAIHNMGPRQQKPFVAMNCAALPDTLLESELFGYKAGAFTGANHDKPGRFAAAENGTLFLDEIGDISPALQVRLLRVLQERSYEPLGSTKPVRTGARVIAATNKDLAALVREGAFRQDLYYRLNVIKLELPPLRQRKEDIPLLAERFIARANRLQGRAVTGIAPEAMVILMAHDYPGNIRELENIIEYAFVLCKDGDICPECLPDALYRPPSGRSSVLRDTAVQEAEARAIVAAIEQCKGDRTAAAKTLGMHKSTLFRRVKALGIRLPVQDGRAGKKGSVS